MRTASKLPPRYTGAAGYGQNYESDWIRIGFEYLVFGIRILDGMIEFLIASEESSWRPDWLPASFFSITESSVPPFWRTSFFPDDQKLLISYRELVENKNHYEGLLERDGEALKLWHTRRKEMEEYYNSSE